jgi:hypothetical protein
VRTVRGARGAVRRVRRVRTVRGARGAVRCARVRRSLEPDAYPFLYFQNVRTPMNQSRSPIFLPSALLRG